MKKEMMLLFLAIILSMSFVSSQQSSFTVCCEKTNQGAFCQDAPPEECAEGFRQVPTSCDQTSYCKAGTCYDSGEGVCMENTPQLVCNENGGIWEEESPPQCELGCCILGDQAAFVTLVRCKKLSSSYGLETNYNNNINTEVECIAEVQEQDKGACVFEFEFERTCKFTTRSECETMADTQNGTISQGEFFPDKLCSADELGTVCGPSTETSCVPGKDEVYFLDTCGNTANIYDASKINDLAYWTNVVTKTDSCNSNSGNVESRSCGNCNYLQGSICRNKEIAEASPSHGNFICADLNCKRTSDGSSRLHGESWCVYNDEGSFGDGANAVGSRFYKHICVNGEEVLEQCEDFRAHECIESEINGFSQAACRVNRWQDCHQQFTIQDCENLDRRDCYWDSSASLNIGEDVQRPLNPDQGSCLPKNPPGLNFWASQETQSYCSLGNAEIIMECEKDLFGEEDCSPSDAEINSWYASQANVCSALGDCGPGNNWIGTKGRGKGFDTLIERFSG